MLRKSISSPLVRFCHGLQSNTSGVDDVVAAEIRDDVVAVAADDDVGAVVANDPLGGSLPVRLIDAVSAEEIAAGRPG